MSDCGQVSHFSVLRSSPDRCFRSSRLLMLQVIWTNPVVTCNTIIPYPACVDTTAFYTTRVIKTVLPRKYHYTFEKWEIDTKIRERERDHLLSKTTPSNNDLLSQQKSRLLQNNGCDNQIIQNAAMPHTSNQTFTQLFFKELLLLSRVWKNWSFEEAHEKAVQC